MPLFATEVVSDPILKFLRGDGLGDPQASPPATTTTFGVVIFANNGASVALRSVQANDTRLSNARTPTAHKSSHQSGGSDAIKLDDLAAPDDNTDLDATPAKHGLMSKLDKSKLDGISSGGVAFYINPGAGTGAEGDIGLDGSTMSLIQKQAGSWVELVRLPFSVTNTEVRFICPDGVERGAILTP